MLQSVTECYRVLLHSVTQCYSHSADTRPRHRAPLLAQSLSRCFMFKFIVSAGCSQLIREIQLYSVSGEAMSNALTREMRAGDTMRHYDYDTVPNPDHDRDTGLGPVSACILYTEDHGPGRDKNAKFYFPLPMSSNVPWLLGYSVQRSVASTLPPVPHCSRRGQHRPAGGAAAAGVGYWIVSLTIAVVLLLLVVL